MSYKTEHYPCWNPWVVCGKELSHVYFYSEGEIIVKHHSGWLSFGGFRGDIRSITLKEKPVKANKLNLNRKDNFIINVKKVIPDYYDKERYILFININEFEEFNVEERVWMEDKRSTMYINYVTIKGGCFEAWSHSEKKYVELNTFEGTVGCVTKTVLKPIGEEIKKAEQFLKEIFTSSISKNNYYNSDDLEKFVEVLKNGGFVL